MKNMNQMTITESYTLKFSFDDYKPHLRDACIRFFSSASMLPPSTSLGMRIAFCRDELPSVTVFSDAALPAEDYAWMFQPFAEVILEENKDTHDQKEMNPYVIIGNDLGDKEMAWKKSEFMDELYSVLPYTIHDYLIELRMIDDSISRGISLYCIYELCALEAVLDILVPSCSDRAFVSIQTARKLPLRVRAMLSDAFRGAEISANTCGYEKGVYCKSVVCDNVINILSLINDKIEGTAMDQRTENEAEEKLEIIEDENPAPIEDLDLSIRAYNCLKRAEIHTIDQLNAMDEDNLMKVRNLGSRCIEEILNKLQEYMHRETHNPETHSQETQKPEIKDEKPAEKCSMN